MSAAAGRYHHGYQATSAAMSLTRRQKKKAEVGSGMLEARKERRAGHHKALNDAQGYRHLPFSRLEAGQKGGG